MNNVVIVANCRTPIGTIGGVFKTLDAIDLSIPVMKELVKRANFDPVEIDDVIWGCNYQKTYKENNLARVAAVKAGLPQEVPGITIHRNCTSSMSAIQMAYYQIKAGEADVIMAGGGESMSNAPHMILNYRWGKKFGHSEIRDSMWDSFTNLGIGPAMGVTAENLAEKHNISREEQDILALTSQQRAIKAIEEGKFKAEIVPIEVPGRKEAVIIDTDEHPRRDTTLEKLGKLKATFIENGTVTAGNASGMNDGAAGVILMSEAKAKKLGVPILAKIAAVATTGVDPDIMGIGPVSASKKALKKAKLTLKDIELFEINEAFAAQYLACEKEMGLDRNITNVNGSGIALGHPVGASGCRLVVSLINEMKRRNNKYALASLCAGGGMGTAIILENYNEN
ncbi:thiolase family protein [Clostridium sp. PL3]|uniref:Acetyl-CoA acetyltransferase n=1 Tax=Clostridium thailandense TaxID=2794346 RepID=A0A949TYQ7_9CLOT|nr:thiolase family protein [Clostridium thailandense]MBV7273328.1 thiolase family protein [Clostridium thailandense]